MLSFFHRKIKTIKKKICDLSIKVKFEGINIGSGNQWYFPFWIGLDQLNGEYFTENSILKFNDEVVKYIYSSHFLEHVNDATVSQLVKESYRCLKKEGVIRIVVPNFPKIHQALIEQDSIFFKEIGFTGRPEWDGFGIKKSIENFALHWFANYQNCSYLDSEKGIRSEDFYRGPPKIEPELVREMAIKLDTLNFGSWIVNQIPSNHFGNGGHINTFTPEKLSSILSQIGFTNISFKKCGESLSTMMANFDKIPNRSKISIYCEATKE